MRCPGVTKGPVMYWYGWLVDHPDRRVGRGVARNSASGKRDQENSALCCFGLLPILAVPDHGLVADVVLDQIAARPDWPTICPLPACRSKRDEACQARIVAIAMIGLAVILPVGAWAGGELADEDHHDDGDTTTGPYGFVKDTRGTAIPEATVTVDIKNRGQLVTQTNILGAYKIPDLRHRDQDRKK